MPPVPSVPPAADEELDRVTTGDEGHIVIDLRDRPPSHPVHHNVPDDDAFATDWAIESED